MRKETIGKTFLICPVRGYEQSVTAKHVADLEADGWQVHYPPRDTDQVDETGLRICNDNFKAISAADTIHFIWDGKSQGCLFDLGMAFALNKHVTWIDLPEESEGKSFQNMVREWAKECG